MQIKKLMPYIGKQILEIYKTKLPAPKQNIPTPEIREETYCMLE